jgi:Tol biopolymer transport system component
MKRASVAMLTLLLTTSFSRAHAEALPEGIMFLGLNDGAWRIHVVVEGRLSTVDTPSEPRTATYSRQRRAVAYVAADAVLYEVSLGGNAPRKLLESTKTLAITQPAYSRTGDQLLFVGLEGGASAQTEIHAIDLAGNGAPASLTSQPGAQFEPKPMGDHGLLYSSVSCAIGCGRIIQEIWYKNRLTEQARQITLGNAIARQPVPSPDGAWVYYSSNRAGNYHIWRMPVGGGTAERITDGSVTDISPAIDPQGGIYFIRHDQRGSQLMKVDRTGTAIRIPLPDAISDIRNLEVSP